jgi:hypothetical protein
MDLLKLIEELRTYRAQVEEAIAATEELARSQGLTTRDRKRLEKKPARGRAKKARKPQAKIRRPRAALVKQKRGRPVRRGKSG